MNKGKLRIILTGADLELLANRYDKAIFGKEIYDLKNLQLNNRIGRLAIDEELHRLATTHGIDGITARIGTHKKGERHWLQQAGFYFVETVLHPWIDLTKGVASNDSPISIRDARENDLDVLVRIAHTAFGNERYHQDENYDHELANRRYAEWVRVAVKADTSQKVITLASQEKIIGFCIYEIQGKGELCYWHLNAIDPMLQGRGLGKLGWQAMLGFHKSQNAKLVKTTITSANTRVLSLYSSLGFRFADTETTFHWVRSQGNIEATVMS